MGPYCFCFHFFLVVNAGLVCGNSRLYSLEIDAFQAENQWKKVLCLSNKLQVYSGLIANDTANMTVKESIDNQRGLIVDEWYSKGAKQDN